MKTILKTAFILLAGGLIFTSCSDDFLDVNVDPKAANADQVQVEYFINNSITGTQMDPHVAERAYILYWKTAARQHRVNGALALGDYNDGWSSDYYRYLSDWLKTANLAVNVAEEKLENGSDFPYTPNLMQVARIWRVYLMSEFTDNFGPMPIDGFSGENPEFRDVKDVYYYMLDELSDATSKIDLNIEAPASISKFDKAYGFDFMKWRKYGNSMRMRLAMRLSEVDGAKAKAEFEAAASGDLIMTHDENFKVQESGGWNALVGVMTREWNSQPLSSTLNNLYLGLGGISSADQLPADLHDHIKAADYMGKKYENHWPSNTNDPSNGFWLDGLPEKIDPRAYKAFIIPGYFDNPDFSFFPSWTQDARTTKRNLLDASGEIVDSLDGAFTWNAAPMGNWGERTSRNQIAFYPGTQPRLSQKFRRSNDFRIFFGNWETYFLVAEAAVRGWSTPMDAKTAYEAGVTASFEYWGIQDHVTDYLQSEDYNRAGTSVKFDHLAEPPASITMTYVDGYTGVEGTHTMTFPTNTIYKNGTAKNDALTKIITQKYLAQVPWLPLEAWNDHRRLGLPFMENPAVDLPILTLPDLTASNYNTNHVRFFPQRLKYPSSLTNSNPDGYDQAVGFLGGPDEVLTPLWWAQKP